MHKVEGDQEDARCQPPASKCAYTHTHTHVSTNAHILYTLTFTWGRGNKQIGASPSLAEGAGTEFGHWAEGNV